MAPQTLPTLGKDRLESDVLLFCRIDAWGPSWAWAKLLLCRTPLTSAEVCYSSHCQAQSLLHINHILWALFWCRHPACPRNSALPLQGWSEPPPLLPPPEGGSATGCTPIPASEMDKLFGAKLKRQQHLIHIYRMILHGVECWHVLLEVFQNFFLAFKVHFPPPFFALLEMQTSSWGDWLKSWAGLWTPCLIDV